MAAPNAPQGVQAAPTTSPNVPGRLTRALQMSQRVNYLRIFLLVLPTSTQASRLEVQGQKPRVRGPGFMVGWAGPRRVYNYFSYISRIAFVLQMRHGRTRRPLEKRAIAVLDAGNHLLPGRGANEQENDK